MEILKKLLRNKRGIETRVLIFVLAAIILVMLIGMVAWMQGETANLINRSLANASGYIP